MLAKKYVDSFPEMIHRSAGLLLWGDVGTGKPLIITTNLHIHTMRNESAIDKKRIYDRAFEMCAPVQMKGASKRKASADSKIKLLRELNNQEN